MAVKFRKYALTLRTNVRCPQKRTFVVGTVLIQPSARHAVETGRARSVLRGLVLFVVLRLRTLFRGIPQLMNDEDAEEGHSLLLFGAEGLIKRLPRSGELLEVVRSLG